MKQVLVKVRSDHLERMSRVRSPIHAVAELIWNALDADATEVRVNIGLNAMLGIDNIRVQDNGHGVQDIRKVRKFMSIPYKGI
jgi:DNA topoisomerase VI subunit B